MARLPRLVLPAVPHLAVQRSLAGTPAFVDDDDRVRYAEVLREALATERVALHAYALADREVLLLATPSQAESLGRLMQAIGRRYVSAYNRRHGRRGPLWEGRFRAGPVEPGASVLDAMLWIEHHGASGARTSAEHHTGVRRDPLLTDPAEYWQLGNTPFERENAWRERLGHGVRAELDARLRSSALGGWAFGSAGFVAAAGTAGRPAAPRPRGRPPGSRRLAR